MLLSELQGAGKGKRVTTKMIAAANDFWNATLAAKKLHMVRASRDMLTC